VTAGVVLGTRMGMKPSGPLVAGPIEAVVSAATSAQQARTAHVRVGLFVSGLPDDQYLTAVGLGTASFTANALQMTITYNGPVSSLDGHLTELVSGGSLYVSTSQIAQLSPGKTWVDIPLKNEAEAAESLGPTVGSPSNVVRALSSTGNAVSRLGPSQVNGVATQGYHVTLTKTGIASLLRKEDIKGAEAQSMEQLFSTGSTSYRVWIDHHGNLRRVGFSSSLSGSTGSTVTILGTVDFSDYGSPVTINPPPSWQVETLQQFEQLARPGGADSEPVPA
jgi:hypothetical protein